MFLKKIQPIAFKNTKEINHWLVENYHDYYVATLFFKKEVYPEMDMGELVRKNRLYKEELNFCFYYRTLKELLTLKYKRKELNLFLEEYHKCKHDEILYKEWSNELFCYIHENIDGYYVISIVYENEKPIGIKPYESKTYKTNPFVLPIDGFESFIELRSIFNLK